MKERLQNLEQTPDPPKSTPERRASRKAAMLARETFARANAGTFEKIESDILFPFDRETVRALQVKLQQYNNRLEKPGISPEDALSVRYSVDILTEFLTRGGVNLSKFLERYRADADFNPDLFEKSFRIVKRYAEQMGEDVQWLGDSGFLDIKNGFRDEEFRNENTIYLPKDPTLINFLQRTLKQWEIDYAEAEGKYGQWKDVPKELIDKFVQVQALRAVLLEGWASYVGSMRAIEKRFGPQALEKHYEEMLRVFAVARNYVEASPELQAEDKTAEFEIAA